MRVRLKDVPSAAPWTLTPKRKLWTGGTYSRSFLAPVVVPLFAALGFESLLAAGASAFALLAPAFDAPAAVFESGPLRLLSAGVVPLWPGVVPLWPGVVLLCPGAAAPD